MPFILNPGSRGNAAPLKQVNYSYNYPRGLNLKPGTKLHEELKSEVHTRALHSHGAMSNRYDAWNEIDETLTAYIPLDTKEAAIQEEDKRRPVSVVVPVSYAVLETLLTYMVSAFLDEPIFRYEPVSSEDTVGAMLLEQLVAVQSRRATMGVQLHTMFRDAIAYGLGAITPVWNTKYGFKSHRVGEPGNFQRERTEGIVFEGNELYNVDPYSYLPDPNYGVQDVQRMEYVGWVRKENRLELLSRERHDRNLFNCKYLEHISGTSVFASAESERDKYGVEAGELGSDSVSNSVWVVYQYIRLIPSEWGIGNRQYPETWLFGLAGDEVLINCGPSELDHNMFPVAVASPEFDGYSVAPISRLETVRGLQTMVDFLYNSHVANVRKAINDMFVVDPLLINLNDLLDPKPGKLIRLRRKAWGRGVKDAVQQLQVNDITASNIADATNVADLMEKVASSPDSLMGIIRRSSERRSATEFKETKQSALVRIERGARMASLQAMQGLATMIASQTQQFMTRNQYVRLVGRYEDELRETFGDVGGQLVGPLDILIDYDVMPHDGTLPATGDAELWALMFQTIAGNELLAPSFDLIRIFKYWARLSGAKNVDEFIKKGGAMNANVVTDEEALRQRERGNIIPMEEAINELA